MRGSNYGALIRKMFLAFWKGGQLEEVVTPAPTATASTVLVFMVKHRNCCFKRVTKLTTTACTIHAECLGFRHEGLLMNLRKKTIIDPCKHHSTKPKL